MPAAATPGVRQRCERSLSRADRRAVAAPARSSAAGAVALWITARDATTMRTTRAPRPALRRAKADGARLFRRPHRDKQPTRSPYIAMHSTATPAAWTACLAAFERELTPQQFATWIRPLACAETGGAPQARPRPTASSCSGSRTASAPASTTLAREAAGRAGRRSSTRVADAPPPARRRRARAGRPPPAPRAPAGACG